MCSFVILLLSNEMQMSVRRFSAIPHLRVGKAVNGSSSLPRLVYSSLTPNSKQSGDL